MYYKTEIEQMRASMRRRLTQLEAQLAAMPEGTLASRTIDGKPFYYIRYPKTGNKKKERRRGITRDPAAIQKMIRKTYLTNAANALKNDIALADQFLSAYTPCDEQAVLRPLRERFAMLPDAFFAPPDMVSCDELHSVSRTTKDQATFHPEDLKSTTMTGAKIRSKSELFIAERLRIHEIDPGYETALLIPDLPFVPDFTVRSKRDGRLYYWEHCGKIHDADYMARHRYKLEKYEEYGIVPWKNLIITYDEPGGGLDARKLEAVIEGWLL